MTDDRIREAGRRLGEAWLAARPVDIYPEELRAGSRKEAYAIQDAMAAVIGESVTGWKLGATSPTMRARAGHDGAIIGRVFESVTFGTPTELSIAQFPDSRVECEFAFRMHDAVPPRAVPWTGAELAERAVLHVAVEIIGNRYRRLMGVTLRGPKPADAGMRRPHATPVALSAPAAMAVLRTGVGAVAQAHGARCEPDPATSTD